MRSILNDDNALELMVTRNHSDKNGRNTIEKLFAMEEEFSSKHSKLKSAMFYMLRNIVITGECENMFLCNGLKNFPSHVDCTLGHVANIMKFGAAILGIQTARETRDMFFGNNNVNVVQQFGRNNSISTDQGQGERSGAGAGASQQIDAFDYVETVTHSLQYRSGVVGPQFRLQGILHYGTANSEHISGEAQSTSAEQQNESKKRKPNEDF